MTTTRLEPLSRERYLFVGMSLMLVKYLGELALHFYFTGQVLNPLQFLFPSIQLKNSLGYSPSSAFIYYTPTYYILLILWTLPFLWIGLTYSVRRAKDAGMNPWFGLGFLIPFWNFVVMLVLSLRPTRMGGAEHTLTPEESDHSTTRVQVILKALAASALLAIPVMVVSVFISKNYGSLLFFSLPVAVGAIASFIWNRDELKSLRSSIGIAFSCQMFIGMALLLFAVEGALCLVMAAPFAFFGAVFGALIGRQIAIADSGWTLRSDLGWVSIPLLFGLAMDGMAPERSERMVTTELIVRAPIETVWKNVVAFPALPPPTELLFAMGIAYPTHATIDGSGVGAIRLCSFSTGDFVEPITHWEPPTRLAFDVKEQPLPLQETNPWGDIHPPHLYNSFRSSRGEFQLIQQPDGSILLRGNTHYRLAMGPTSYWALLSDQVVHTIHLRVLNHIKHISEAEGH